MYKTLVIGATALLLATPALAEPPGNEHYDNGGPHVGGDGGPTQMSDQDFFDALREGGDVNMGLGASGKDTNQGSAGKGSFGSDAGDND